MAHSTRHSVRMRQRLQPYVLLLPATVLIGVFKIFPILYSLIESFFKTGRGGIQKFVGFRNYLSLFSEPIFANSLGVTLWFCLITTTIQVVLAIALALFLNHKSRMVRISRHFQHHFQSCRISCAAVVNQ